MTGQAKGELAQEATRALGQQGRGGLMALRIAGYSCAGNHEAIAAAGAPPFSAFKTNAISAAGGVLGVARLCVIHPSHVELGIEAEVWQNEPVESRDVPPPLRPG